MSKHTPDVLSELRQAAARKWQGDPAAQQAGLFARAAAEVERLKSALTKISGIRDSMIGCQKVNWSEHVYPLVAALDAAGFEGVSYEVARDQIGTLLERTNKAEAEVERLRASERRAYAALDKARLDSCYYSVLALEGDGMEALRQMFPEGKADELNMALFTTSGVHGTYCTIEQVERGGEDASKDVTFLIIQPRIVCMRYGECRPETADDFAFLKRLRSSSIAAMATIGVAASEPRNGEQR